MLQKLIDEKNWLEEKIKNRAEILPPIPGFFEMAKYHPTPLQIYKNLFLDDSRRNLKNTFLFFMQNKKKTAEFCRRINNLMTTLKLEGFFEEVRYFDRLKAVLRRFYMTDERHANSKDTDKYADILVKEFYDSNSEIRRNGSYIDPALSRNNFFRDLLGR